MCEMREFTTRISMLDNGMDSLKKGFENYLNYVEIIKNKTDISQEDYLILKQAVSSIHHGIEILYYCL